MSNLDKKLIAIGKYSKKIAARSHDTRYYESYGEDIKNYVFREKQKALLSTPKFQSVTDTLEYYRELGASKTVNCNVVIQCLFNKNAKAMLFGNKPPKHTKIMNLVSQIPLLVQAYAKIKTNKGAMTEAAAMSPKIWNELTKKQRVFINSTISSPDGISMQTFLDTSELLKKGIYPWGTSKRIYIPKPGTEKLRPLTIPPFMDRVVQQVIRTVLESIYEPWFDETNRSFGFRPGKGTHDAIVAIKEKGTGLTMAIEGDIQSAYDKVDKEKLVEILAKRITDRKFLNFIKERLNYTLFDTSTLQFVTPTDGIPQGGVDSPYLFNIYMKEFDDWITKRLEELTNTLVYKKKKTSINPLYRRNITKITKNNIRIRGVKTNENIGDKYIKKIVTYYLLKRNKKLRHNNRNNPYYDQNCHTSRFLYVRYADDWIILTNKNLRICFKLKQEISEWLLTNLKATLSQEKTKITNISKTPAFFLGFGILSSTTRKLSYVVKQVNTKFTHGLSGRIIKFKKRYLAKVAGAEVRIYVDKQRVLNRQFLKGYCNKHGIPKEIPRLSVLEPFVILERFNSVVRGLVNFYSNFLSNPSDMSRWIYILRFSCLKTLAQKYKVSIHKLFSRYNQKNRDYLKAYGKTIEFKRKMTYTDGHVYEKSWKLITYKEVLARAKEIDPYSRLKEIFWTLDKSINKDKSPLTLEKYLHLQEHSKVCHVKDFDYTESINFVNWRSMASFDMPCAICGSEENINMHHVKHVRKNKFSLIPVHEIWTKTMSIRNRKQIPVCRECHMKVIHGGQYAMFSLRTGFRNTIFTTQVWDVSTYVKKSKKKFYAKTLEEKGWKQLAGPPNKRTTPL